MRLLIQSARVYSQGRDRLADLRIASGRIAEVGQGLAPRARETLIDGRDTTALPGLINAHDHLGLNLLPRLGTPPYQNFYQWAEEIYRPEESPVREVLAVPLHLRLAFSGYRNLLAGVTTVAHHDPLYPQLRRGIRARVGRLIGEARFPMKVIEPYCFSHSLGIGPPPKTAFESGSGPFLIHAAEGIDEASFGEIDRLDELDVLSPRTVLIHAIATSERSIARLQESRTSVVWCPESNQFLYGETAPIERLLGRVTVTLGTDSTLSGSANLLDEMRVAAATGKCSADQLLEMVTSTAALAFGLEDGRGTLEVGAPADLVLIEDRGGTPGEALVAAEPRDLLLVLLDGQARVVAESAAFTSGELVSGLRLERSLGRYLEPSLSELEAALGALPGLADQLTPSSKPW